MTSADDTTPIEPNHQPLDHDATAPFSPPTMAGNFEADPTLQVPVAPTEQMPAMAPTPPLPPLSPQPTSVVLSTNATAAPKRKGTLAWALAGIATIAAVVLGVLWVGKSGEADDLAAERTELSKDVETLEKKLEVARADLESAEGELESVSSDLATAEAEGSVLQTKVDELEEQLETLVAVPTEISDELALALGQSLAANAATPISDADATCLGREVVERVGFAALVDLGFNANPSNDQLRTIFQGIEAAIDACGLNVSDVLC